MMINHLPEINSNFDLTPFEVKKEILSNGLHCYYIDNSNTDIIKFNIVFKAGTKYGNAAVVKLLSNVVFDGSLKLKGEQFAEMVDQFGAYVFGKSNSDRIVFTLVCQKKNFADLLTIFLDAIFYPELNKDNINNACKRERNALTEAFQYNATLAEEAFIPLVIGENSPYGQVMRPEAYHGISHDDLYNFHKNYMTIDNCYTLTSGEIGDSEKQIISRIEKFSGNGFSADHVVLEDYNFRPVEKQIVNPYSSQSYLLLGNQSIIKNHPDYIHFKIVSTLLGGYIGSRLMQNIREKSGYTYDIFTSVASNEQLSIFRIASEIKSDSEKLVLKEIEKEISKLKDELITDKELMRLRNYLSGELLNAFDGMFARDGSFLSVHNFGMELSYYQDFMSKIKSLDKFTIQSIANQYLNFDNFVKIIVKPE